VAVKKTRWSILILEDHPDLRETLRSNFADLCGAALRVEFAASICHAIDKIKKQMRRGDPFDIFWIDLYLDYFSYEDELGEIVTVDSFSQIIDTDAFLQRYSLPTASLSELIQKLEIPLDHVDKSWRAFTPVEKLRVLEKFLPFSIPIARSTYATFLETCEFHLRGEDAMSAELNEANLYARYALDFVFRLFLYWLSSPRQREFSPFEDAALAGSEMLNVPILPERQNKSDQSWTIFHTWVQQFYDAVAMGVSGFEEYTAVNLLLQEIKRLSFYGYPQFLVNTAYQRRRQELVSSTTVGTSQNVIVASNNFKGEKKDREFVEHLFRICRRLRRPYLALKRHRRGAGAYLLPPSELNHEATTLSRDKLHEDLLTDNELGIAFSRRAFYPELTASFDKAAADARAVVPQLLEKARQDLQADALLRQPATISLQSFCVPLSFLGASLRRDSFHVEIRSNTGSNLPLKLRFDEGRWLFLELARCRWFPKCFYMHSTWTARENQSGQKSYFFPASQVLHNALLRAALKQRELFPAVSWLENQAILLPTTSSFNEREGDYMAAFDWEVFFETTFGEFDASHPQPARMAPVLQARRLLLVLRYLLSELQIRRLAAKLISRTTLTPEALCYMLESAEFSSGEEVIQQCWRQIEKASETPHFVANNYLPGIKNTLAVLLCFYTLPSPELMTLFHFWQGKQVPPDNTRPTEKFSSINKKLGKVKFTQSAFLPAQADGKSKFLYIPPTLLYGHEASETSQGGLRARGDACSGQTLDFMTLEYQELLHRLHALEL